MWSRPSHVLMIVGGMCLVSSRTGMGQALPCELGPCLIVWSSPAWLSLLFSPHLFSGFNAFLFQDRLPF